MSQPDTRGAAELERLLRERGGDVRFWELLHDAEEASRAQPAGLIGLPPELDCLGFTPRSWWMLELRFGFSGRKTYAKIGEELGLRSGTYPQIAVPYAAARMRRRLRLIVPELQVLEWQVRRWGGSTGSDADLSRRGTRTGTTPRGVEVWQGHRFPVEPVRRRAMYREATRDCGTGSRWRIGSQVLPSPRRDESRRSDDPSGCRPPPARWRRPPTDFVPAGRRDVTNPRAGGGRHPGRQLQRRGFIPSRLCYPVRRGLRKGA